MIVSQFLKQFVTMACDRQLSGVHHFANFLERRLSIEMVRAVVGGVLPHHVGAEVFVLHSERQAAALIVNRAIVRARYRDASPLVIVWMRWQ